MNIICVAIDDEPLAIRKLESYIAKVPFLSLAGSYTNPVEALDLLNNHTVNLLFLDIQMDELTGIQLLETIKNGPKVIITSAFDQYALKSYEFDVCDYLLKPYSFTRFIAAVNKACLKGHPGFDLANNTSVRQLPDDFIFVKEGKKIHRIDLSEILYIEGMKEYLGIHTTTSMIMALMTFKKMEETLPAGRFIRIHKSFLIALDKIQRIENQQVILAGRELQIGDSYKTAFFDIIKFRINF